MPAFYPKISCIIPTCDRPGLLARALGTVLRQTLAPHEIIVVNNGKDKTRLPADMADRVKVADIMPYAGVAQARNFGAFLAAGKYLAFLDDDCQWNEKYLENAGGELAKGAECVLSGQYHMREGKLVPWKIPTGRVKPEVLLVSNPGAGGPNIVIARDLFFRVRGYDVKLPPSEDKALVLEILRLGMEIPVLPDNAVIDGEQEGVRLTNHHTLAEGVFQFTRKYRHLMNREQYFFNRWKMAKYGGKKFAKYFWGRMFRLERFWRKLLWCIPLEAVIKF